LPTLRSGAVYHPSSAILPRDLPDSSSACARFKLAALVVLKSLVEGGAQQAVERRFFIGW
jgi:hypothetical protein